jgi:hypothetical protein
MKKMSIWCLLALLSLNGFKYSQQQKKGKLN